MSTILCIPDIHAPFQHPRALEFLAEIKRMYQPDLVIQLGDFFDAHTLGRFEADPSGLGTMDEYKKAVEFAKKFYKLFPKGVMCRGNHEDRYLKRAFRHQIPAEFMRSLKDVLLLPKEWKLADSYKPNGIVFHHGEGFGGIYAAQKMLQQYRMNVVHGHLHSLAGVTFLNNGMQQNWCLSCGCLVDPKSYAFAYGKHSKDKPILGVGLIIDGVPLFLPMR